MPGRSILRLHVCHCPANQDFTNEPPTWQDQPWKGLCESLSPDVDPAWLHAKPDDFNRRVSIQKCPLSLLRISQLEIHSFGLECH